jgi:hypothetical protein
VVRTKSASAGDILNNQKARIILCSIQYVDKCRDTFTYVKENDFDLFVQWLNPGYNDPGVYFDHLGLIGVLLSDRATISMRDGKIATAGRVQEIRQFIYGWAKYRKLLHPCGGTKVP